MLDESLLDDPDALGRADTRGLLLSAAAAGARVRIAARLTQEAGVQNLRPDGRPRSVLVAGTGPETAVVADVLAALGAGSCPVIPLRPAGPTSYELHWTLPGWTGPLDLLLLTTSSGREDGLVGLVEQAYRRGCTVAAVAPAKSPLAEALEQARGMTIPFAGPAPTLPSGAAGASGDDPGALWALLTPLLTLADRIGLFSAPPTAVQAVADRLDEVAARCGPAIATYNNPAKTLATELADALPLLWSTGPIGAPAARRFAAVLAARTGRPALAAELPEALAAHGALLAGTLAAGADPDDFFRDRTEDNRTMRLRVVLLREAAGQQAAAAPAARELAYAHETPLSEIAAADGSALETAAELLALTDFAAVYLAVASSERS
ncbi:SIS domain-containing protein [Streptomyces sp. H10-C2]|uniref:SIS domain-containing protein n=1 Tax=unclassified Streptomyces TaxID=2593676 RepID=UPI0024B9A5F4|nr:MULTISPECIES: SIS domain-containing protein [unclassified Streptomyces]MDJ0341250.1 SIS domain-containing protein [Streptomyces sp. PH10-H1]MDJ0370845.1 SIS domain-containing protein [Streptomyces sp. H10-C2]